MMKKSLVLSLLLFNSCCNYALTIANSTSLSPLKFNHKIHRCYGVSKPTQQKISSITYTDWWRCDGKQVTNQFITCPPGYVSVGIYTWYYTDTVGLTASRCRAACAEVTAYIPPENCQWEG